MRSGTKQQVSRSEYLQVMGLLVLAKRHEDAINDIKQSIASIVGEPDDTGHVADAVYNDYTADELLKKLGMTVAEQAAAESGAG